MLYISKYEIPRWVERKRNFTSRSLKGEWKEYADGSRAYFVTYMSQTETAPLKGALAFIEGANVWYASFSIAGIAMDRALKYIHVSPPLMPFRGINIPGKGYLMNPNHHLLSILYKKGVAEMMAAYLKIKLLTGLT